MHETTSASLREVSVAQTDDHAFSGYGAVFGNKDSYVDAIEPGAFAETLGLAKSSGVWPALPMQHGGMVFGADDLTPIGVWTELAEDSVGLRVSGKLADTPRGREAYALLKMEPRPAITGLSIGYVTKQSERGTRPDEPRRYLKKLDLLEIFLVTFPANPRARVESVKGINRREIERLLTQDAGSDCGFRRKSATCSDSKSAGVSDRSRPPRRGGAGAPGWGQPTARSTAREPICAVSTAR